jgi:hypothetical protein
MGATGAGPFENDDALDFLDDLEDSEPTERRKKVVAVMERVIGDQGYIEAPSNAEAVAPAALVAASEYPQSAAREPYLPPWLEEEPLDVDEQLEELATQTLHRALRHDDNEWWELWEEADASDEVTEVLSRYLDTLGD